jgi:hypothetical protein
MANNLPLVWSNYERLAHKLTGALVKHSNSQGRPLEYQDVFQEVYILFDNCVKNYSDESGVPFSVYFFKGGLRSYQLIRKRLLGKNVDYTESLDRPIVGPNSDGDMTLHDVVIDRTTRDPEALVADRQQAEQCLRENPALAKLVAIMNDPPEELRVELERLAAQQEWARQLGFRNSRMSSPRFTLMMLRRLFNFDWRQHAMAQGTLGDIYA